VAADVLLRLALLTGSDDYRRRATTVLRLVAEPLKRFPSAFGRALGALDFYLSSPKEIAILGDSTSGDTRLLRLEVWKHYLPNKIVVQSPPTPGRAADALPLLKGRSALNTTATAFVCEHYSCQLPVTQPEDLASQLGVAGALKTN
jgi:uncharacterized protein YyaL (SSP411 family)